MPPTMVDIQLMRPDPAVLCEGRTALKIVGQPSLLLRLLGLHEGNIVSKEEISRLNDTASDSVSSKARDLKGALREFDALVQNMPGAGYYLDTDHCTIDAANFRTTVEPIVSTPFDSMTDRIDRDSAIKEVGLLSHALDQWRANPASGLSYGDFIFETKFDTLREKAEERLVLAQLFTGQRSHIIDAIGQLEFYERSGEADEFRWRLLLLAYDAIGSKTHVDKTWGGINEFYGPAAIPQTLDRTMSSVSRSEPNPFRLEMTDSSPISAVLEDGKINPAIEPRSDDQKNVLAVCEALGITTASRLRLTDSQLAPEACIAQTRRRLWFSGVLASKWVSEPAVRAQLDGLLERLDAENGEVRFMMINPKGEGYTRLRELRRDNISLESVDWLRQLAAKHPSFEVRMFDSLPSFRVVIIDDDVVSFSPYRLAADAYMKSVRGWDAPHVVLDPLAPYPLAEAFQQLFSETWNSSKPLGD